MVVLASSPIGSLLGLLSAFVSSFLFFFFFFYFSFSFFRVEASRKTKHKTVGTWSKNAARR